ncbi:hypothetical protein KTAU_30950 [Thermogemmatispora aurantia]|nr:hypothetical protein KTAU_30950 [Thermogemmatispora aurantia]
MKKDGRRDKGKSLGRMHQCLVVLLADLIVGLIRRRIVLVDPQAHGAWLTRPVAVGGITKRH